MTVGMDLKVVSLHEISQSLRDNPYMIPLTGGIENHQTPGNRRTAVAWPRGREEGESLFKTKFQS